MAKAAIIHGTYGHPEENWFPWLAAELRARKFETIVPQMPTPEGQELDNWLRVFHEQVGPIDEATLLIGHSVGAVFVARLLEKIQRFVAGAIFAAPFTRLLGIPEFDPLIASFVDKAFDWQKIRTNGGTLTVFCGDNDPYVPHEQTKEFAAGLKIEPIVIPGGGHLNAAAGFTTFPLILKCLEGDS